MKRLIACVLICSLFIISATAEEAGNTEELSFLTQTGNGTLEGVDEVNEDQFHRNTLDAGYYYLVAALEDGHAIATEAWWQEGTLNDVGQLDVSEWENIVSVAAGYDHTVGLMSNGTVVGTGRYKAYKGIEEWTDIIEISCGFDHTVGLKEDGTVVAAGENDRSQADVSGWTDIVDVVGGGSHTVGLKKDGTVVAVGWNEDGQCNVNEWRDIVSVAANNHATFGLKADGTVVYTGKLSGKRGEMLAKVKRWSDIVWIKAYADADVFGIKSDGTILCTCDVIPSGTIGVEIVGGYCEETFLLPDGTLKSTSSDVQSSLENLLQGRKVQVPTLYRKVEGNTATTSKDKGIWTINAYVDEFNLPTDNYYIANETAFDGTFSNSATSNSILKAFLFYSGVDEIDMLSIRMLEYGSYRVNNPYSKSREYTIVVMDSNGNKTNVEGLMFAGSYDVYVTDEQPILDALKEGGTVRLAITEKNDPLTKYIITIDDATGFDAAYREYWSK